MTLTPAAGRSRGPLIALAALCCSASAWAQDASVLAPFLVDLRGLRAAKVTAGAKEAMSARIIFIVDRPEPSPTGDAHDYVSFARYYWPNPDTPSHLPFVRRDGRSNDAQVALGDEPRLDAMIDNVGKLALGWAVLHREDCARRAGEWLRGWFVDPATLMHPNLDRGQIALGLDDNRGRGEGILDARGFIGLVDALRMLHGSPALGASDEAALRAWFGHYLEWMLTSRVGNAEHAAPNNHGSWFLAQSIAIARYAGRDDIARMLASEDLGRIARQIEPDGAQPLELARTNSLDYSVFNLTAQVLVARLAKGLGVDLFHYTAPNGASLAKAAEYLRPYNRAPEKWPGGEIRKVEPGFLDEILAEMDRGSAAR
jgi:hypothetical protein